MPSIKPLRLADASSIKDGVSSFEVEERIVLDKADIRITGDGYMVTSPRVARTGIQLYRGDEMGRPDLSVVRVYRPEDQVFNKDSMHTFAFRPITNDHPPVAVTADNWKDYSVGTSGGEVARDGEFIRVPMTVMDGSAIAAVRDGKSELSVGYATDIKWGAGKTPDGFEYDAIQTNIRANHIAIVDAARGGAKLRIGDGTENDDAHPSDADSAADDGDDEMNDKSNSPSLVTMDVDSIPCQMTDVAAAAVKRMLGIKDAKIGELETALQKAVTDSTTQKTTDANSISELQKQIGVKDAEIATLKKQVEDAAVTPEKLDAMVRDRDEVIGKGRAVLGNALVIDGKTIGDIRKQVVLAKIGDAAKGWNDDQVAASFATMTADVKPVGGANVVDASRAFSAHVPHGADAKVAAQDKYDGAISERWKGNAATK
jgi:hypothetical protein